MGALFLLGLSFTSGDAASVTGLSSDFLGESGGSCLLLNPLSASFSFDLRLGTLRVGPETETPLRLVDCAGGAFAGGALERVVGAITGLSDQLDSL